jgi:peptide/nickel transport system permease protein
LGQSIYYREDVGVLLKDRIPVTLYLGLAALIASATSGIGLGAVAAARRGKIIDKLISGIVNAAIAIPVFWLAILLIYMFGLKFRWIPIGGYTSPFDDLFANLKQSILPVICLSVPATAVIARQMRTSLLEVLRQDYIRAAWAKGLMESRVVFRHALKNSLIPVVNIVGTSMGRILGGAVIIETIFVIPGMGRLMATSIFAKDYVVIQSGTLVIGLTTIICNILADISYCWCDPRIRHDQPK